MLVRASRSAASQWRALSLLRNCPEIAVMLARGWIAVNERAGKILYFPAKVLEFSQMSSTTTIETFPNPRPGRDYEIFIDVPEFTSLCPNTGLPDFGEIRITYVPNDRCIELKSLKYYFIDFRNRGIFYEAVTNQILDDLVAACEPRRMTVVGDFTPRGGIKTVITASHESVKQVERAL
jgi:7-cyano-7-deazaguanine reductase